MDPTTIFLGDFHGTRISKDSRAFLLIVLSSTFSTPLQANAGKSLYLPNIEKKDYESIEKAVIAEVKLGWPRKWLFLLTRNS
jgi:hypothetical protein